MLPSATSWARCGCRQQDFAASDARSGILGRARPQSHRGRVAQAVEPVACKNGRPETGVDLGPCGRHNRDCPALGGFVEIVHRSVVYGLSFQGTLRISAPRSETGGPYRLRERVFRGLEAGMKNSLHSPLGPTSLRASIESLICLRGTLLRFPGGFLRL